MGAFPEATQLTPERNPGSFWGVALPVPIPHATVAFFLVLVSIAVCFVNSREREMCKAELDANQM